MRCTHGNTTRHQALRICYLNPDGIMRQTRGVALSALPADIIAISETHLTAEHHKLLGRNFYDFTTHWGAPATGKKGVGFLIRNNAVWAATPLKWGPNHPCARHYHAGRLHAISIHSGKGNREVLLYVIYGIAGARWNSQLRHQTHQVIESVLADAAARGLPALMGGDLNLEQHASDMLQRLPLNGWSSIANHFNYEEQPTCYKGGQSHIDHVYANALATPLIADSFLGSRTGFADHVPILVQLRCGPEAQTVWRSRHYGYLPQDTGDVAIDPDTHSIGSGFQQALQDGDVTYAHRLWNHYAEKHLQSIARQLDASHEFKFGRGSLRIDNYNLRPTTKNAHTVPLRARQLWRHICRMCEIIKRPHGTVAARAWYNAWSSIPLLYEENTQEATALLTHAHTAEAATRLKGIFENTLAKQQTELKQKRIQQWKLRLQSSTRAQHAWAKHRDASHHALCIKGTDGHLTANIEKQFAAVRQSWQAVTDLFKHGEPSHEEFFRTYGQHIVPADGHVPPLTGSMLCQAIKEMSPSSPGLDAWNIEELQILQKYCPWVYDPLASLLTVIEDTGTWPMSVISGYTSLIPKDQEQAEDPTQLRPITVLSILYRIWGRIRYRQLQTWHEVWAHDGMWGGRVGRGPEPLFILVSLQLERATENNCVAGLSYDLSKAFDRIPRELLGQILTHMRMPQRVLRPYLYMLRHVNRRWKLGMCLDRPQPTWGGILQGCPLSVIAMNSIVNIWLHAIDAAAPQASPRSYIDDVSITTTAKTQSELVQNITVVHKTSTEFIAAVGAKQNTSKSCTFGDKAVDGLIHPDLPHRTTFRLVGGSIATRNNADRKPTALELQRLLKWNKTAQSFRHLPVSWNERCQALNRTRSQATWGAGTHRFATTKAHDKTLVAVRSNVMRCLLRRDRYNASPSLYLALLHSPSLNPYYSRIADGLCMMWRVMHANKLQQTLKQALSRTEGGERDGPVARLRQVESTPGFGGVVTAMLDSEPAQKERWLHNMRETWRKSEYTRVSRDRPSFRGIEQGILRTETLGLHEELKSQGRCEPGHEQTSHIEARMNASVLRLLLTGGLFTQDVQSRHVHNKTTACDCAHGGPMTVEHIHWQCAHFATLRSPLRHLARRIQRAQPCFKYATILTPADVDLAPHIRTIQHILVQIWRTNMRKYLYQDDDHAPSQGPPGGTLRAAHYDTSGGGTPTGIEENGHFITAAVGGGVFCRKCGKFVKEIKHRRLKISYRKCEQAQLAQRYWTETPNYEHNPHRLLELFRKFITVANGHDLAWNCSVQRPGGRIQCLCCNTTFAWSSRHNIGRQPCRQSHSRATTPDGHISERIATHDLDLSIQRINAMQGTTHATIRPPSLPNTVQAAQTTGGRRYRVHGKHSHTALRTGNTSSTTILDTGFTQSHEVPAHVQDTDTHGTFLHFDDMG